MWAGRVGLVLVLLFAVGCAAAPQAGRATESPRPSGIRLLVGGTRIVDVDTGAATPVTGLPADRRVTLAATVHGPHTVIAASGPGANQVRLYLLKGSKAVELASGWNAFPAADGSGFWVMDQPEYGGPCTVREQAEDGTILRRPRWSPCGALPYADTPYGLHARHRRESLLLTHDGLRKTARYPRIVAATSRELLVERKDGRLALVVPGEKERPVGRPSGTGVVAEGEVSSDGTYVAVPFLTPTPGAHESLDVWVLDTRSLAWTHVPSMPLPVDVKSRRMSWTPGGRLVLAGGFVTTADDHPRESDHAGVVVLWRPGEASLTRYEMPVDWRESLAILRP
ncbi:hypothetical protein AB0K12_09040 [Nonomuraea sp. NPDC049419]|uniref:hypothetical protein n=1 Tax=Nonomuraea sp. NPDC049419 TaxID=3155772 RepID=UPI00341E986F